MSLMSLCVQHIHNYIEEEVLEEYCRRVAYKGNRWIPVDKDSIIIDKIIHPYVMVRLNLEYARRITVPVSRCQVERVNSMDYVITVPPNVTMGNKIVTVLGLNLAHTEMGVVDTGVPYFGGSAILAAGQKLANSHANIPLNYLVRCQMISPNSFRVERAGSLSAFGTIDMIIEHDAEMSSLDINASKYFFELVLLAAKAAIFKTLRIPVNKAKLDGGSELGVFSEIIESYADAHELLEEKLSIASRIAWLSDAKMKYELYQLTATNLG